MLSADLINQDLILELKIASRVSVSSPKSRLHLYMPSEEPGKEWAPRKGGCPIDAPQAKA